MSVQDAEEQGVDPADDPATYTRSQDIDGTRVWSNNEQSVFSWDRGGVRVFVLPGPRERSYPPEAAYALVAASADVPPPY